MEPSKVFSHCKLPGSLQRAVANVNLMRLCMHMQVRDQEDANRPRAFQRERLTMHEDQIICRSM